MNDETTPDASDPTTPAPPASGNRWESSGNDPAYSADLPTATEAPGPSRLVRPRAGVAAVAVAGLLMAGVGGFAVGRVTAGDGEPGIQQVGFQPGEDDDRDFPDGGPDGGPGDRDGDEGFHGGFPGGDDGPGFGDDDFGDDEDDDADDGSDT